MGRTRGATGDPGAVPTPSLLCPTVIGRSSAIASLHAHLDDLGERRGGVVALVGDAGSGKSRLARVVETEARRRSVAVLWGRCAPSASPVPYRPLSGALLECLRAGSLPDADLLGGFAGHLARFVPAWPHTPAIADDSPLLVGEALLRVLEAIDGRGSVLVLEDLHWADAETLAVVEHLADATRDSPVLCVITLRPSGSADDLVDRLVGRRALEPLVVEPLTSDEAESMVAACLGAPDVPPSLRSFVLRHGDGNPYVVEELLAGLLASGALRHHEGRWCCDDELRPTVPSSVRSSIGSRLSTMDRTAQRVLAAAALLGRRFDWQLLPGIAELDGRAVVEALRAAVDEQLISADGEHFRFRHALTQEVVLDALLRSERRELASRAWPAVERANPGLPGPVCELASELAEEAGDLVTAAARSVLGARRALGKGALHSAEIAARRAHRLLERSGASTLPADEVLLDVLVVSGQPLDARRVGEPLVESLFDAGERARAIDASILVARAAVAAGDTAAATVVLARAREAIAGDPAAGSSAAIDAVAAHVALDEGRLDDAEALATAAAELARATGQPEVECEAAEVLGRIARVRAPELTVSWFGRAADVAAAHGLVSWQLRARHELALEAWNHGDVSRLADTRHLAVRHGALFTAAVMDLSLADIALSAFDRVGCLGAAGACVEASQRFGLATEPVAHLWMAGAHALAGDDDAMHASIGRALQRNGDDHRILGDLYGRVLATRAFVADELEELPALLEAMMPHVRAAPPTTSVFPGRLLWATLHTLHGDDLGAAARSEVRVAAATLDLPVFTLMSDVLDAIASARSGRPDGATEAMAALYERFLPHPMTAGPLHCHALLLAPAAARGGWGDPVAWLRAAESFFAAAGYERTARRCRRLLGEIGAPVPRRRRGAVEVPPALRARGVTSREVDVLALVAAGLTNREIADRLVLSPKTVERHLASLFTRLGAGTRREAVERAEAAGWRPITRG